MIRSAYENSCALFNRYMRSYLTTTTTTTVSVRRSSLLTTSASSEKLLAHSRDRVEVGGGGEPDRLYYEPSILLDKLAHPKDSANRAALHDRIPVVLLLGWTGCRDVHLRKYQAIYQSLGYHTIRMSPSNQLVFLHTSRHKPLTYQLLDLMRTTLPNNPICVHMFSNASLFVLYQHIVNETSRAGSPYSFFARNHKCLIVDSAFGWSNSPLFLVKAIADLVHVNVRMVAPLRYLIAGVFTVIASLYHMVHLGDHYYSRAFRTIRDDKRLVPTLALLTRADKLIPIEEMLRFYETRRSLYPTQTVKTVVYDDGEHVKLFAKHTDDYLRHVHEHLVTCGIDIKKMLADLPPQAIHAQKLEF